MKQASNTNTPGVVQRKKDAYRILFVFFLGVLSSFSGVSQSKNFIDHPFVETSAQVDTLVTPDRIYLSLTISEKDTKDKLSVEILEFKMVSALKTIGINTEKDLTLNDVASKFKNYFLKARGVLKSKSYSLMVRDAQTISRVMVALEAIGISNVLLDRVKYSNTEALKLGLRSKAIRKAKQQAEYLAAPLNQNIGAAISISDRTHYNIGNISPREVGLHIRKYAATLENKIESANLTFEKVRIESAVNVKFKLE